MSNAGRHKNISRWGALGFCLAFAALIAVSAAVRLPYLTHYPPQVHNDESATGTYIKEFFASGNWALYGTTWGHPNLNFWLSSLPTKVTGEISVWTIRLACAIEGIISLIFFGLAVKKLLGARTSLFFLLIASVFHLHAHYSRTGFIYNHAVFFISLITLLFAHARARPTRSLWILLGAAIGLSILVYPATQLLPFALIGAEFTVRAIPNPRSLFKLRRYNAKNFLWVAFGTLLALGPQIYFWITYGFESRVRSQFFLLPPQRKHLEGVMGGPGTALEVLWFNIKSTAGFFYRGDLAVQYGFFNPPLATVMAIAAILGVLVMVYKALRGDHFCHFVLLASIGTFICSSLLVEGSFSPHLIIFGLYLPLFCAVGFDSVWRVTRIESPLIVAPIMLAVGVWWGRWNFAFYQENVVRWMQYRVTYILNLPIETTQVRSLISLSTFPESLNESFYTLVFPNASKNILTPSSDDAETILRVGSDSGFPALAVINSDREQAVVAKLKDAGKAVTTFNHSQGAILLID
jgi:4-amino-4-deoxy-L-arabinose transferase-like glycosyltransferase